MLHSEQIQYLKDHFRITDQSPNGSLTFQSVQELFDPQACRAYLQQISEKFHTTSLVVTASQFAKRYSFLLVIPTLYAMSVYHKGLPIDPENCYIQSYDSGQKWLPRLALADWKVDQPLEDRARWREQLLKQLFAKHLAKIWAVLQECTRINPSILWENTTIYIHWLYTQFLTQSQHQQDVQDDYQFLLQQADRELFGVPYQPLQRFSSPDGFRQTCCLSFLTNEEKKVCKRCPRRRIRQARTMAHPILHKCSQV